MAGLLCVALCAPLAACAARARRARAPDTSTSATTYTSTSASADSSSELRRGVVLRGPVGWGSVEITGQTVYGTAGGNEQMLDVVLDKDGTCKVTPLAAHADLLTDTGTWKGTESEVTLTLSKGATITLKVRRPGDPLRQTRPTSASPTSTPSTSTSTARAHRHPRAKETTERTTRKGWLLWGLALSCSGPLAVTSMSVMPLRGQVRFLTSPAICFR